MLERAAADRVFWELRSECRRCSNATGSRRLLDAIERIDRGGLTTLDDRTLRMVLMDLLANWAGVVVTEGILRKLDAPSELDAGGDPILRTTGLVARPASRRSIGRIAYLRLIAIPARAGRIQPGSPSRRYFVGREADMEAALRRRDRPRNLEDAARVRRGLRAPFLGQPPI
ncbi:MAG: hypothetical protein U0794_11715 [Isosphaeraceae bacterium]